MNIAIVGASGAVGRMMIQILEEYGIEFDQLTLFASKKSAGQWINCFSTSFQIQELNEQSFIENQYDLALFSAGGSVSEKYALIAEKTGCIVIDNSSTFRQDEDKALVVPEINADTIDLSRQRIIANPNCSTIQCVIPLAAIDKHFGIKRIDYATYQAVSGAGEKGIEDLLKGEKGEMPKTFAYPIYHNVIPQIDQPLDNGYTKEEMKMVLETQKILRRNDIEISATCVRVPVLNAHSIDIKVEFEHEVNVDEVKKILAGTPSIILKDNLKDLSYPMPIDAVGQDQVLVGRLRQDLYNPKCIHFFCCADNLRKGAASNAVQIADYLIKNDLVHQ